VEGALAARLVTVSEFKLGQYDFTAAPTSDLNSDQSEQSKAFPTAHSVNLDLTASEVSSGNACGPEPKRECNPAQSKTSSRLFSQSTDARHASCKRQEREGAESGGGAEAATASGNNAMCYR